MPGILPRSYEASVRGRFAVKSSKYADIWLINRPLTLPLKDIICTALSVTDVGKNNDPTYNFR